MHIGKMTNFEFLVLVSSHSDSTDYSISGKEFLQSSLQSGFLIAETFLTKSLKQYKLFQKNLIRKKKSNTYGINAPFKLIFWWLRFGCPSNFCPCLIHLQEIAEPQSIGNPFKAMRTILAHSFEGCNSLDRNPVLWFFHV